MKRERDENILDAAVKKAGLGATTINVTANRISDLAPLVDNAGLGAGDYVSLCGNPLSAAALETQIPALRARAEEQARYVQARANALRAIATG